MSENNAIPITVFAENKDNPTTRASIDLPALNGKIKDFFKELGVSDDSEINIRYAGTKDYIGVDSILLHQNYENRYMLSELNLLSYLMARMNAEQLEDFDVVMSEYTMSPFGVEVSNVLMEAYNALDDNTLENYNRDINNPSGRYSCDNLSELLKAERALRNPYPEMSKEVFWQIIDDAREKAGSWQDMRESLVEILTKFDEPDIVRYELIFEKYMEFSYKGKLWAAAEIMHGGCSDDGFIDFRSWLIAQGKEVYLKALTEPDSLAYLKTVQAFAREYLDSEYMPPNGYYNGAEFESMLSAAGTAYEIRLGSDACIYDALGKTNLSEQERTGIAAEIVYAKDIDAEWLYVSSEDRGETLAALCPKLYKLFNHGEVPEREKESVLEKIRQSKQTPKSEKPKTKKQSKGEPER